MWLGRGGGVKGSIMGRVIFAINKMCGVSFENKRVTVCFFVCLLVFFVTKGVVSSVWCTSAFKLHQSFNQSKHCDK